MKESPLGSYWGQKRVFPFRYSNFTSSLKTETGEKSFLGGNKVSSLHALAGKPTQTLRRKNTFRAPQSFFFFWGGWA